MDSNFSSMELLGDTVRADQCDPFQELLEHCFENVLEKRASILRYALTFEPDIDLKIAASL